MTPPVGASPAVVAVPRLAAEATPWRTFPIGRGVLLVTLLALLPFALGQFGAGRFLTQLLLTCLVFAVVTQAWNLVLGVAGILSVAQLVFYAIGGYASALLSMNGAVDPWLSLPLGAAAAALAAVLIGLPILRLRGIYIVLLTLGMNELLRNYIQTGPVALGRGEGLRAPGLFDDPVWFDTLTLYYLAALAMFAAATYVVWWTIHSPIGLAFTALRDSETYAAGRGIDRRRVRTLLFAVSAFITGFAGAFMTQYQGLISPAVLDFSFLITLQAMIVVGGWGTFAGPILGTFVIVGLRELVQPLGAGFTQIALGALMAGIVVAAPQGLWPTLVMVWDRTTSAIRGAVRRMRS